MTHWDLIAAERRALADLVEGLTDDQLGTPSLCGKWTVKDVAAHVMVGPTSSYADFAKAIVKGRGSFDAASEHLTDRRRSLSQAQVVAALRDHAESHFSPPTMDWHAPLTDVLVHREDIVVPLGLASDRPRNRGSTGSGSWSPSGRAPGSCRAGCPSSPTPPPTSSGPTGPVPWSAARRRPWAP